MNDEKLNELWNEVHELNSRHFPGNTLAPILGGGKTDRPKTMLVFINPTARNTSSDPSWKGPRFPFIGTKQVWRIFHRAGLFDEELLSQINNSPAWSVEFTKKVLNFLQASGLYITNIVKWTGKDATLPDAEKIRLFLPILEKEIEIVKPERIVTFGLIPFERLTKQKIRLNDYYTDAMKASKLKSYQTKFGSHAAGVIPCYFPIGRGNPSRAVDILRLLKESIIESKP